MCKMSLLSKSYNLCRHLLLKDFKARTNALVVGVFCFTTFCKAGHFGNSSDKTKQLRRFQRVSIPATVTDFQVASLPFFLLYHLALYGVVRYDMLIEMISLFPDMW